MARAALVAIDKATLSFDKEYTYLIPSAMQETLCRGCRVLVPFGAGNRSRLGVVLDFTETEQVSRLKAVSVQLDVSPLIDDEMVSVIRYLRRTTFCTYFDAVRAVLPSGIGMAVKYAYSLSPEPVREALDGEKHQIVSYLSNKSKPVSQETITKALGIVRDHPALVALVQAGIVAKTEVVRQKVQDGKLVMVRLADGVESLEDVAGYRLTAKQTAVIALLAEVGQASVKEVAYYAAAGKSVVDKLEDLGLICYFEREVYRNPYEGKEPAMEQTKIHLSYEQQSAYQSVRKLCDQDSSAIALLYGVTGSGKTQVFLSAIEYVVSKERQVLVLVPEISLTPQTIDLFHRRFGKRVAVLHSGLTMSERMDEWKRIKRSEADIVVGTRSAVFAPLSNIGLIVIDEEQENTYKSERSPRFHAKDIARLRVRYHRSVLLLSSATPSIESFHRAKQGTYQLITMKERYGEAKLPDVTVIDLVQHAPEAQSSSMSGVLIDELYYNLQHKQQSILLLNRRGYHTIVKCSSCSSTATCPNCSVALTYHNANKHLMCHYCGYIRPLLSKCTECGSEYVRYSGAGTQKVEEELHTLFPDARVLRMDMDTTMSRFAHEKGFRAFAAGEYDIMVGTQMVAKGLDFPNVTLVGVLNADTSLYSQDFRSFEKSFSLLTQVVGRCGRGSLAGRAFIQTLTPENRVIALAATQNYDAFFYEEIESRRIHLYPPFCDLVGIGFSGAQETAVRASAARFLDELRILAKEKYPELPLRVLGPCECGVLKVAGKYRYKLSVKCSLSAAMYEFLWNLMTKYHSDTANKDVSMYIDPRCDASM